MMSLCMTCKYNNDQCAHDDFCLNYESNGKEIAAIVRCRDCIWWEDSDWGFHFCTYKIGDKFVRNAEDYCSRGKRKDGADE